MLKHNSDKMKKVLPSAPISLKNVDEQYELRMQAFVWVYIGEHSNYCQRAVKQAVRYKFYDVLKVMKNCVFCNSNYVVNNFRYM